MDHELIKVDEISKNEWKGFIESHRHGNVFQTRQIFDVYRATKRVQPFLVVVKTEDTISGIMVSYIEKEMNGLFGGLTARCITRGGPLISRGLGPRDKKNVLDLLLKEQDRVVGKKAIYMQYRNMWDTDDFRTIFEKRGNEYNEHLNILIDLKKGEDTLWNEMNKKRRNSIRKAEKTGIETKEARSEKDIQTIYEIYHDVYKHAKVPISDNSMFVAAHKILGRKDMVKNLLAFHDGIPIGAISVLAYKGVLFDWYAGGLIEHRNKNPNDLLPWVAMKWGIENGYHTWDFGGAGSPNEEYGVRDFKLKFGGTLVNYGRYQKIYKKNTMKIAKAGLKLIKGSEKKIN